MCPGGNSETSLKLCRCLIFIMEQSQTAGWVKDGSPDLALLVPGGLGSSANPHRPQALSRAKTQFLLRRKSIFRSKSCRKKRPGKFYLIPKCSERKLTQSCNSLLSVCVTQHWGFSQGETRSLTEHPLAIQKGNPNKLETP